jgi:uncharacterized membrane protein
MFYLLILYIHLLATIVWAGYILFWTIVIGSLSGASRASGHVQMVDILRRTSWPPVIIPQPYRLQFPWLGWLLLIVLLVTGVVLLHMRGITLQRFLSSDLWSSPFGRILLAKLSLVTGLVVCHSWIVHRPAPRIIYPAMLATLVVVGLSVLLVH